MKIQKLKRFLKVEEWEPLRYCRGKSITCGSWGPPVGPQKQAKWKMLLPAGGKCSTQKKTIHIGMWLTVSGPGCENSLLSGSLFGKLRNPASWSLVSYTPRWGRDAQRSERTSAAHHPARREGSDPCLLNWPGVSQNRGVGFRRGFISLAACSELSSDLRRPERKSLCYVTLPPSLTHRFHFHLRQNAADYRQQTERGLMKDEGPVFIWNFNGNTNNCIFKTSPDSL